MTVLAEETVIKASTAAPCHRDCVGRIVPVQGGIKLTTEMMPEITARMRDALGEDTNCILLANGLLGAYAAPPIDFLEFCATTSRVMSRYLMDYQEVML